MESLALFFLEHTDLSGVIQFFVFTVILGGGAAFLAGRAVASGWAPAWTLAVNMLVFTAGLRFLDYALFGSNLTSLQYYISHGLVVMAAAFFGFRLRRVEQMTTQYPWLYERSGLLSWQNKS
ncbi:MAG: hypothetical protein LCH46_05020 [Proteobacteria bacterium]|nr:hypothetical protein [Pseudomonadota bacterium]